jgi:cytochrome c-type biogenesis protein CcmH/NrfF
MCIAAYLAIGGGLGVSLSTAAHLRTALLWLCWSVLALLAVRMVLRFRTRAVVAARQVFRSAQPNTRRSPAQSAAV